MLGLRKPNFRTKIIHFETSHNAENCKRGPLRFFNNHSVAKFQKKLKGNPLETLKNFRKKNNENFSQSHSAEKSERDPLGFFNIRSVAKYQNKLKGGPFEDIKNFSKKMCLTAEKSRGGSSKRLKFYFSVDIKQPDYL